MNCWNILKIEPTSDKKAIKKAYAVLLKLNKPDENPEGFAQLHAAYQQCLKSANTQDKPRPTYHQESLIRSKKSTLPIMDLSNSSQYGGASEIYLELDLQEEHTETIEQQGHSETVEQEILKAEIPADHPLEENEQAQIEDYQPEIIEKSIIQEEKPTEESSEHNESTKQEEHEQDTEYEKEQQLRMDFLRDSWGEFEKLTDKALEEMERNPSPRDWAFLENHDALYDIEFKSQFSLYLFQKLLVFFENGKIKISQRKPTLFFLNKIFNWSSHFQLLQDTFGLERSDKLLNQLSEIETSIQSHQLKWTSPKKHQGPLEYASYYARIFATAVDLIVLYFIFSIMRDSFLVIIYSLLMYVILTPILEATPLQGSPSKVLFGIKVCSPKGKRLNIFHALWRQLMFILSTAGIKITVWINFFINDGRLLHDRVSHSIVIKR